MKVAIPIIVALLFSTLTGLASAATPWRTTHFNVYFGAPELNNARARAQEMVSVDPDSPMEICAPESQHFCAQVKADMEGFLHDLAVTWQSEGFADPTAEVIQTMVTDDDGLERVRVYFFDFSRSPEFASQAGKLGFFSNICDGARRTLLLNSTFSMRSGRLTDRAYQNAAHELFHAVQFASKFREGTASCGRAKWIFEGIADAVGFDYAKRLRNINFKAWGASNNSWQKPWGVRQYLTPLSGDTDGYQSSSFWRHLAEWNQAKMSGSNHPGSRETPGNYGFLVRLFEQNPPVGGVDQELTWLDKWMKSHKRFSRGLAPIYAQFTATMADLWTGRIHNIPGVGSGNDFSHRWIKGLFGECPQARLDEMFPRTSEDLVIDMAAAACFSIFTNSDGYQPKLVVIENSNLNLQEQQQLYIGAVGGQLVSAAEIGIPQNPTYEEGRTYAKWEFLVTPGITNYFVVANMGRNAGNTINVRPELHFSIPDWKSSLTEKSVPSSRTSSEKQPKSTEQVAKYRKSLREFPTTQSATSTKSASDFGPIDPSCTEDIMVLNLCGRQLSINLSMDFGLTPGQGPVTTTGGMANQIGALELRSASSEAEQISADLEFESLLTEMARNNTGNFISISIPLILYGEEGNHANARIEVSGPIEGEISNSYLATSPAPVSLPNRAQPTWVYPPNGSVAILEYTPHILRGSFHAVLVSREEVRKAEITKERPNLPIWGEVSGEFAVSAPWRGNEMNPDTEPDGNLMSGIRSDMMELLLTVPEGLRQSLGESRLQELCKLGFGDEQLSTLGIGGSCAGGAGGGQPVSTSCDCSCINWEYLQQLPGCESQCDARWRLWQCGPYLETGLGELDEETSAYQAELQQLGLAENEVAGMTLSFRDSPAELRAAMRSDLENYRAQANPEQLVAEVAEIEAERAARGGNYDAETLRYWEALEQAGWSPEEVAGLVEIFAPSPEVVRQIYWQKNIPKPD